MATEVVKVPYNASDKTFIACKT